MDLSEKLLTRKDEITTDFFDMVEKHVQELLEGKAEKRFHSADFAKLLFIHPRHLTNTLKLTTGKSPCDVMEERVMLETEKLLSETDLSIADIGNIFGYEETTNFIKFFKSMAGITPLQYRKKLIQA